MHAYPVIRLLCFFFSCQWDEQDSSATSDISMTAKTHKKDEMLVEVTCPDPIDIEPCECSGYGFLVMDCSLVEDEDQLRQVFSAFFPNTTFERFYMEYNNGLTVLEDGVFGDVSFREINIHGGVLETVRNTSLESSLSILASIHIEYCQLTVFPFERLEEFTALKTLSLHGNRIHSLPPLSSSSLKSFDLRLNPISLLSSDVFTRLAAVEQINLDETNLTEILPETFRGLPELFILSLMENQISHLQSLTFGLVASPSRRANLFLERNNISVVEANAFEGVESPSTINIAYNALTTIPEEVWRPVLEKNISVIFAGNSLTCGCDIAWLVFDPEMLTEAKFARCGDGTLLTDLDPADFEICL